MAYDASSKWTGWGWLKSRTRAFLEVTTKGGDAGTTSSSDPQGVGWAQVVALTDGEADSDVLGSAANPLNVTSSGAASALNYASASGTITTGGTAQNLVGAASGLSLVELCNPSNATESLFANDTGAVATGDPNVDIELPPGGSYVWANQAGFVPVPTDAISIQAATTGHHFRAKTA